MSALIGGVKAEANKRTAMTKAKAKVSPFIVSTYCELKDVFSSPQRTLCSAKRTVRIKFDKGG